MALSSQYRTDIQGLRAVAVIAVIVGHLFPATVKGGFIGVDIFFVISGYVITQQMVKSHAKAPHTFLRDFYFKRIKRILPSALLVTAVSIFASSYFLGPVAANQAKLDGAWVSIFLGNSHFQDTAVDYFSTGIQPSVLQHYWSLSIEEQFYLLWPTLFLFLTTKFKSLAQRLLLITAMTAISLLTALYQSEIAREPIFFATSARIWELGVGALLALCALSIRVPEIAIYLSLAILVLGCITIEPTMQWPDLTTIPVIAVTGIVLLNNSRVFPVGILQNKAIVYIGDISYVLYLWHWPILMIYKGYATSFGVGEKICTVALTVILSVVTHHFIENPIRFSTRVKPLVGISIGISTLLAISTLLFASYQG